MRSSNDRHPLVTHTFEKDYPMLLYTPPKAAERLPIIDLSDSFSADLGRRKAVAWEIHKACRDTGFFYVANHGVAAALIAGQFEWAERFFAQPLAKSSCMRGYEAMSLQVLDAGSPPDLKEGFQIACDLAPDHPYVVGKVPNQGPNQWPGDLPGFREHTERYQTAMIALGTHLMRCLALSLELDEGWFDAGISQPMCTVRMLHYPPQPAGAAFNQLGAGAHTDWGSITMLLQDDCGGLEVQNAKGEWIEAAPVEGTFVVNLGDMVRRWTNDIYQSTMHRVLNKQGTRDRYSIASFFNPDFFYKVECLPTCHPADGTLPRYAPCTVGEHIAEMFQITYGKKKSA
jgi:isopenicillin N synthase-like dioxygenase